MSGPAYSIIVEPLSDTDGGGFLATVPELPGCIGDGNTAAAATMDVIDAIPAWVGGLI